jgi:hypothetical protein
VQLAQVKARICNGAKLPVGQIHTSQVLISQALSELGVPCASLDHVVPVGDIAKVCQRLLQPGLAAGWVN